MKSIPSGLLAHYQSGTTTIATCWKVTLQSGSPQTVLGFTDHDKTLVIDGLEYLASTGFMPTAYETQSKGAVDNLEAQGFLDSDLITEQDILNGVWDFAEVEIFQVNWNNLSLGKNILTKGHLGQISTERGRFSAELRGLANALSQSANRIYSPTCRVEFGSTECGINLSAHTYTGTITSVSSDGLLLGDTARTEGGPDGKAITGITKAANPTVTCTAHGFVAGQRVFFYGVGGMTEINGQYAVIVSVTTNTFVIDLSTSTFSTYTSGGTASVNESGGFYAAGKITMTSGESQSLSMEVKESAPGLIILQLQFARGVAVGDTYSIVRGCAKRYKQDCVLKFANGANFRGHPHIPGLNKVLQTGGNL
jgi:hypothetical protein